MDYYQGTDLWYQVDNYAGHWELYVTNSQGADLQSNARAAIIKDILVYFVPANEIPADFPGYRFSAFGCAAGGFGSGYCAGDVSGVDPTVPPIPVPQEKVFYGGFHSGIRFYH